MIGLPIYNFGVPATLKAWVDQVARAGVTFRYTEHGPEGLLQGKRAIVAVASGGTEAGSEIDFATGYIRHMLAFIGITEVQFVTADRLMLDAEASLRVGRRTGRGPRPRGLNRKPCAGRTLPEVVRAAILPVMRRFAPLLMALALPAAPADAQEWPPRLHGVEVTQGAGRHPAGSDPLGSGNVPDGRAGLPWRSRDHRPPRHGRHDDRQRHPR